MGRNLTQYFRNMSLKDAWEGDFGLLFKLGMPKEQIYKLMHELDRIKDKSLDFYLDYLREPDSLFRSIYGDGYISEGRKVYTYPFVEGKTIPDGIREVVGPVGTQTSIWHRETLREHACLVAANLCNQGHFDKADALLLAVLHDIGKKYTAATNNKGGVCFYNHAELSAFIAGHLLRKPDADNSRAKRLVAIIYGHMQPLTLWNQDTNWKTGEPVDYKVRFLKEALSFFGEDYGLASETVTDIDLFKKCDEGVEKDDPNIARRIKDGRCLFASSTNPLA